VADEQLQASRPGGYSVFLWPFLHLHLGGLPSITLAQHLLGLAMAAAIYLLLLRLRVWPWLAALATAPLLLDSMQLSLEQYVMSDVVFEALLLGACLLLLWRRRPGAPLLLAAGLALGLAATVRGVGVLLLAPAAVTAVALGLPLGWRRVVWLLAALGVGFALPLAPTWPPSTTSTGRWP
jgi:4-amino-4-deoxy-L-arabinose transferase-like glycosyltransferase